MLLSLILLTRFFYCYLVGQKLVAISLFTVESNPN